jgi:hypothetical protein
MEIFFSFIFCYLSVDFDLFWVKNLDLDFRLLVVVKQLSYFITTTA